METRIWSASREVIISYQRPTVLIGERINPTGKKALSEALKSKDMDFIRREAIAQVEAGADVLDVNVGVSGADEVTLLPEVIKVVTDAVDAPLCIDTGNPGAIEAALRVYGGKALINSVSGEEDSLNSVLPLAKEYGAAVVALLLDEKGIPDNAGGRLEIAAKILQRADSFGISRDNIIIDCLVMAVGTDMKAGLVTLETIRRVRRELDLNITLGVSNISFGMPERGLINNTFLSMAIMEGVTCPIVDAAKVRTAVLTADLVLGRDSYGASFIKDYRRRKAALCSLNIQ